VTREDPEVSAALLELMRDDGIDVILSADVQRVRRQGADVLLELPGREPVRGSHLLIAIGRTPNTSALNLPAIGVRLDRRGQIEVDDQLRSSQPHIYALGDINGRGQFTHTSYNDYEIVAANVLDGDARRVTDRILIYGLFTDPPLGRVGMTEAQVRASGRPYAVGQRPMTRVSRAIEKGETLGFMKILVDTETKRILGACILGTGGDEAIHGVLDMINAGATYPVLQWAVPIHPTVSELIPTLLNELRPPS
jgi:pyruvate/2-oxoglutarate dehydrogenase complex dihydrolipoamide dehydrogenase (E3) component